MRGGSNTRFGPIGVYVSCEEALGEAGTPEELRRVTAALPRTDAAGCLSALGAALDMPGSEDRQCDLADSWLVPEAVGDKVKQLLIRGDRSCWLHAGMLVVGWRALALWGTPEGHAGHDFPRLFTRWLFLLTDAYGQAQAAVIHGAGQASSGDDVLTGIAFVLQTNWAQHSEDVFYTLSREYSLLFEMPSLLKSEDSLRERVDSVAPDVLGASLRTCLAVGIVLWIRCYRQWAPDRTQDDRVRSAVIDTRGCFEGLGVSYAEVQHVLEHVTQTFDDLRASCCTDHTAEGWHPRDLLAIRSRPLIAFGPAGMVALTLPRHVVEAFTAGLYHRLSDHFRVIEKHADSTFRSYWGKLVEAYTGRLLSATFPDGGPVKREVFLPGDPSVDGVSRFDGVVMYPFRGQTAIVFESVSKPFVVDALTGLDLGALDQDIKLIMLDKVRQLSKACSDLRAGTTRLLAGGKPLVATHFTPVLVTWQGMPVWAPVMNLVDRICAEEGLFAEMSHDPVQILSMQEFERLLELVWCNRLSLLYILRQRATDPRARDESMDLLLYRSGTNRRPGKRHPLLGRSFEELRDAVIGELKAHADPSP